MANPVSEMLAYRREDSVAKSAQDSPANRFENLHLQPMWQIAKPPPRE
jgi:hypothetical protein